MSIAEFSLPRIQISRQGNRLLHKVSANRSLVLITLVASIPVIVAFARAAFHGWWPQGDDAVMGLKVWDIFHGHPPLMGMRTTSGAADPALSTHHPGPLEFYLLALPDALVGFRPVGLLIGTALIGLASLAGIAALGHRRGGLTLATLLLAGAVSVQWAVGPETLFRPLNPYPAVLPVLLLLTLTWSLLAQDLACMWAFALTASFVAQAHVAYLPLVAALTLVLAAVGWARWHRRRGSIWPLPGWRPVDRSGLPRPGRRALIVLVLCWLPVVIEMLRFDPNNLTLMIKYLASDPQGSGIGWHKAAALVSGELAPIPGGFSSLSPDNGPLYSGTTTMAQVLGVCLAASLLLISLRKGRLLESRTRTRGLALASAVALYGLVATCISVALIPVSGVTPRYYIILLWPVVGFAWAVLAWALVLMSREWLSAHSRSMQLARPMQGLGAPLALLAAGSVLACNSPVGLDWASVDPVQSASAAVAAHIGEVNEPSRPVSIEAGGWVGWLSLSPAVAYRLRLAGHPVFTPSLWPYPQDDDFRRIDVAPADSIRVLIREKSGRVWYGPDVDAGDSPSVTFPSGSDGRIDVYVDR